MIRAHTRRPSMRNHDGSARDACDRHKQLFERSHASSRVWSVRLNKRPITVEVFSGKDKPPVDAALWGSELKALTQGSRHLLQILGAENKGELARLVMAPFESTSLQKRLNGRQPPAAAAAPAIVRGILTGLAELHRQGFVYSLPGSRDHSRLSESVQIRTTLLKQVEVKLAGYALVERVADERARRIKLDLQYVGAIFVALADRAQFEECSRQPEPPLAGLAGDPGHPFLHFVNQLLSGGYESAQAALRELDQLEPTNTSPTRVRLGIMLLLGAAAALALLFFLKPRSENPGKSEQTTDHSPIQSAPPKPPVSPPDPTVSPTQPLVAHAQINPGKSALVVRTGEAEDDSELLVIDNECVGYRFSAYPAPPSICGKYFGPVLDDAARDRNSAIKRSWDLQDAIYAENQRAKALSRSGRPLIRLVYVGMDLGDDADPYQSQIDEFAGLLEVQHYYNQSERERSATPAATEPVFEIGIASAGTDLKHAPVVIDEILQRVHPTVMVGFVESRLGPQEAIRRLNDAGVLTLATTLSAAELGEGTPFYIGLASNNDVEAQLFVQYALFQRFTHIKPYLTYGKSGQGDRTDLYVKSLDKSLHIAARTYGLDYATPIEFTDKSVVTCPAPRELVAFLGRYTNYKDFVAGLREACRQEGKGTEYWSQRLLGDDSVTRLFSETKPATGRTDAVERAPISYVSKVPTVLCKDLTTRYPAYLRRFCKSKSEIPGHTWLAAEALRLIAEAASQVARLAPHHGIDSLDLLQAFLLLNGIDPRATETASTILWRSAQPQVRSCTPDKARSLPYRNGFIQLEKDGGYTPLDVKMTVLRRSSWAQTAEPVCECQLTKDGPDCCCFEGVQPAP